MSVLEQKGMYEEFPRSGKPHARTTHYCPGCGHGIINKLVAECCAEMGLQDQTIFVDPVGCGVFTFYYWDASHVSAAHGRASAVATGVSRARPDAVTIAYQGDGDLGAIGFNNAFQAASRGEKFGCIFINNSLYGMTGGQMAPTTLDGERTTTTPFGRDPSKTGYPLHVCEIFDRLEAPVYIARVSVADTTRIMKAKQAIRRVFEIQRDHKGYAILEILAPCPTNLKMNAVDAAAFCANEMEKEFPLGVFRDVEKGVAAAKVPPHPSSAALSVKPIPVVGSCAELFAGGDLQPPVADSSFGEHRYKFAGYGGQGVLSLGLCIASAAQLDRRHMLWFPSYGPEQRGGYANCSVVVSGSPIGAPTVEHPDVLVCMNRLAYEQFAASVPVGGTIVVDSSFEPPFQPPSCARLISWPATELAEKFGEPRAANTMMLAALVKFGLVGISRKSIEKALVSSFKGKTAVGKKNLELLKQAIAIRA